MRSLVHEVSERRLFKDECLFRDRTAAEYVYFFVQGRLRVEKEVDVSALNYWPQSKCTWRERKVMNHILYKVASVEPYSVIGERECSKHTTVLYWPLQIVADCNNTLVYMLAKKDLLRMFNSNEMEKLKLMSVDEFPTAEEVVQ